MGLCGWGWSPLALGREECIPVMSVQYLQIAVLSTFQKVPAVQGLSGRQRHLLLKD